VRGVFDKLYMWCRAVEGRSAVWQIAKRRACVHQPLLSVGLIAQQRCGSVRWVGWAGHEPTAAAYRTHKGRSFSLRRDHDGSGGTAEIKGSCRRKFLWRRRCLQSHRCRMPPAPFDCRHPSCSHVTAVAMSAAPFDRRVHCL